ncbi:MAG: hypothetical protein ABIH18_01215 [Candidatus Omnitrophota bacterium]
MKNKLLLFCIFSIVSFSFFGCANLKEVAKGIVGISTKEVEKSRLDAIKKDFNLPYEICYDKTLKALKNIGSYVYTIDRSKDLVAIYVSEEDTTCAGLFFTEIDANNTQVEVASPSTYAKELIADKLFKRLEKSDDFIDEKKDTQEETAEAEADL